ncbi:DUF6456 domain-containing protein [Devosia epidermidihirudinis]|uniref:DUF6456 domain-containing protein n=1 Tax=Devosia epidermidihirudinis TaxID=1293439 RepID=UPI00069C15BF|nr:DUF6456 domain-containing protein [Devosia epidermidihirudinis]
MRTEADDAVVARLAASKGEDGATFLLPHHVAAADRLARLIERSRLVPRVTMSYDPARVGGGRKGGNGAAEVSDSAVEARQALNRIAAQLPGDCWGVVFDVCGLGKGLQAIEIERRWPRRSAKLILRIGLEQLADQFGLQPHRASGQGGAVRGWLETRPAMFADG